MSTRAETSSESKRFQFNQTDKLNRPERIALIVIAFGIVSVDLVGFVMNPGRNLVHTAISVTTTAALTTYIWSPMVATSGLGLVVVLSFFAGTTGPTLLAAAVAAALVLRLGTAPLIISYLAGLLISNSLFAYIYGEDDNTPGFVAAILVAATVAGGVGLALRLSYARGHRLEHELVEQAEREREAVLAERRWIAGELHDSIAHHLTVIAMHVQLIDDDKARPTSQQAIQVAARKSLSDLRFVIELAEDSPRGTEVPSGDLAAAIDEASEEFKATGHPVSCNGDPADENIPRGAEIILARIVRESATNVLKYAGPGEVRFGIDLGADSILLTIRSPLPDTPRRDLPSTGTGLNRMAERVLGVSGEFSAGPDEDAWLVSVRLPVA